MKKQNIVFHVGNHFNAKSMLSKGQLIINENKVSISSEKDLIDVKKVYSTDLVNIEGCGILIKLKIYNSSVFLAVPIIYVKKDNGKALINTLATKKLKSEIDKVLSIK